MAADAHTLMNQAPMTADKYLLDCIRSIDEALGDGYAKAHPEVLAAMLRACSFDFATCMTSNSLDRIADAIHSGLSNMA